MLMKYINDWPECCALPDEVNDISGSPYDMKYRKKIRELENEISSYKLALMHKDNELNVLMDELSQREDWIRRLLEYTELSEEDMKEMLEKEKAKAKILGTFDELCGIMKNVYRGI